MSINKSWTTFLLDNDNYVWYLVNKYTFYKSDDNKEDMYQSFWVWSLKYPPKVEEYTTGILSQSFRYFLPIYFHNTPGKNNVAVSNESYNQHMIDDGTLDINIMDSEVDLKLNLSHTPKWDLIDISKVIYFLLSLKLIFLTMTEFGNVHNVSEKERKLIRSTVIARLKSKKYGHIYDEYKNLYAEYLR